ncbi:MAG TPA: hypothetical protein VFL62_08585 [Bradyrhizobium sp.]|uniref:hypothetical protein n=1 Tax=Bradyrhizobium sp. TaxID=376 RepID=UPI002D810894|nr:hypothetical protein [Bradyrhizobium sp.]HET7886267.1 hypothetical protein [Bradyrhizobium sp.]
MGSAPPLVPASDDHGTVYLVLDNDGGRLGPSWRETDQAKTDLAALLVDLVDGQYNDPVRVVAFNTAEGWARDASTEVADLIAHGCARDGVDVPAFLRRFVEQHGSKRPVRRTPPLADL